MRTTALILLALAPLLGGCTSSADSTATPQTLLANGHGVDHVTILTKDLAAAAHDYRARLGFNVGTPTAYSFGFTGANIYFADGTFIELYAIHDPAKVREVGEEFALEAAEGVRWVTLHSGSTANTANLLKQRGIPSWGPLTLPENVPPDHWSHRLAGPEQFAFPGGRLYFVEYNEALRAKRRSEDPAKARARETHLNGALGLRSVWIAVRDLNAAAAKYEAAGLLAGPEKRLMVLDTTVREIKTPGGTILLLQSRETNSPRAEDAFAGISIKTEDIERVRTIIQQSHAIELRPYRGLYGRSILVPAALARGASIEFFE